ncbi:MAG: glutamate--cysteine ligase [Pseudomonadota bacterium]
MGETKSKGAAARPIETKSELVAYLEAGCKPKSAWMIGTEHEKFGFLRDTLRPLPYDGARGVRTILEALRDRYDWEPVFEGENIIGLKQGGASVSLEPGGQFELSGAPLRHLHETCDEVHTHLHQLRTICDPLDIGFLGLGFAPHWAREDMPVMPKGRYDIMRAYMAKKGALGLDMMLRTATVQVNLDFSSEADMRKKFRVSMALQPIATALFANSPFTDGKPNGYLSKRANVWTDTDPDRTGLLHFVFEEGFGFERYVDYILDVPMYFVKRDGAYIDVSGESFRSFMEGRLPQLPGETPSLQDWDDHLTTAFPEVRMKRFLEMRGADGGPWARLCALPAFWVGLLYDEGALDAAWDLCKDWTETERETLRLSAMEHGLAAPFRNGSIGDIAHKAVTIARAGLKARADLDAAGQDETGFLTTLEEIVEGGRTHAEELLAKYHGVWNGDVSHIFEEYAY